MATALFVLLLLCSWNLILCDDTRYITVRAGENVHLECWFPVSENDVIKLVEWKKPDLKSERYVFCFKDNHFNGNYQHPLFHDRVELRDPEMKNGNFSVVLKNVAVNDAGTYECQVRAGRRGQRLVKRHRPGPVSIVELTVRDSGLTQRHTGGGDKGAENKGGGDMREHSGLIAAACVMMMMMVVN